MKTVVPLVLIAMLAASLMTSCYHPAGRRAVFGGAGGAIAGGILGGRRGAVAGAVIGGTMGALSTPSYSHGYYPPRPPRSYYGYY